ncbi:MAG: SulP family inorganic anion transporter, partial [Candidatus Uhrbacteria bacterium]|nr:SulP family inorganic anion transporter [Candidatus Uhrbacteria bacterium]
RKEMFGLGIANIVSGAMGGIPATAALARTSLNIKSGASNRMSGIMSAIGVALISLMLLSAFRYIPLAVIAAILVFVAVRMVERQHFSRMWKHDKKELVVSAIVAFVTVYEDPIVGILLGVALALLIFMEKISRGQFELIFHGTKDVDKIMSDSLEGIEHTSDVIIYSIKGQLAYINSQSHVERFEKSLNGYKTVILRLRELAFIDLDGVEAFNEIVEHIWAQKKRVIVSGVHPLVESILNESDVYKKLVKTDNVFKRTNKALESLGY